MNSPLCALSHVATTAQLITAGYSRGAVAALSGDRRIIRIRRGLLCCAHLTEDERYALNCAARLDCITVLRAAGIWTGASRGTHLRYAQGTSRRTQRMREAARYAVAHWAGESFPSHDRLWVSVPEALRQAMGCLPPDDVVAAIESAVRLKAISADQALMVIAAAPRRLASVLGEVDTEFRAQSGYETLVRLRLTRLGHRVEPQALIPGVGHVDNLVDGVLAVETDGKTHENSVAEDRRRDLATRSWGIRVLRVDPGQVDHDWDAVLSVIELMLASEQGGARSPAVDLRAESRPTRRRKGW
ncbi:DUF559 domain-containing protein [Gryllotalpicola sp.]|uniref:endonuclease domain-containing protein n=1 Tax=Gryllotalpicola sp. TaxID=1932787 RepID=UPI002629C046|nr:DUF559 domain-containing protein [Gryllotalpicola sp.]